MSLDIHVAIITVKVISIRSTLKCFLLSSVCVFVCVLRILTYPNNAVLVRILYLFNNTFIISIIFIVFHSDRSLLPIGTTLCSVSQNHSFTQLNFLLPFSSNSMFPPTYLLATSILLYASMSLITLDSSYKWNHTPFVLSSVTGLFHLA